MLLAFAFDFSDLSLQALLGGVLIAIARIFDVSMGVLRFVSIGAGRRGAAWLFGFLEALIWVVVVASVVDNLSNPIYAVFYALGFAFGTFVGMVIEQVMGQGEQAVRIFTRHGDEMAEVFREKRYRVTQFEGKGKLGPVQMLFIHVTRKRAPKVFPLAQGIDPDCFIVIDDVRSSYVGAGATVTGMTLRK
jgi:uncharacterized protein YebE (UPF0316 family)